MLINLKFMCYLINNIVAYIAHILQDSNWKTLPELRSKTESNNQNVNEG